MTAKPETLVERSPFRTVEPPPDAHVSTGDSIRAVCEYVGPNIAEVHADIDRNRAEYAKLVRRLEYLTKLAAVADEYAATEVAP